MAYRSITTGFLALALLGCHAGTSAIALPGEDGSAAPNCSRTTAPTAPTRPWTTSPRARIAREAAEGRWLFSPDFVLLNAKAAGLSESQITSLQEESRAFERRARELRARVAKGGPTQGDRPLHGSLGDAESALAELHELRLALLVRVRDQLTAEQRDKLEEIHSRVW